MDIIISLRGLLLRKSIPVLIFSDFLNWKSVYMLLKGKIALITGAARGIGRAIAETFVNQGASVVLVDILPLVLDTVKAIQDANPGCAVLGFQCDITVDAEVRNVLKKVREMGALDILVNNAGVLQQGLLGMSSVDLTKKVMDVNSTAIISLSQYAIRMTPAQSSLSIINLASIAGTLGMEGTAAYSASKGAVVAFTRAAAKELAGRGIRMNALAPGYIDTDMTRQVAPELQEKLLSSVRMGRIGTPQDVANCALFLASDLSAYVTGQILGVDGGMAV
jgi:3-oxoacyl-[acyl-carrier protein] reductase